MLEYCISTGEVVYEVGWLCRGLETKARTMVVGVRSDICQTMNAASHCFPYDFNGILVLTASDRSGLIRVSGVLWYTSVMASVSFTPPGSDYVAPPLFWYTPS